VDWIGLIRNDDNYKNILQVIIQKEFKVTPHYLEMEEHHSETGYSMGVFLCLGQAIHETNIREALPFSRFTNYLQIHEFMALNGKLFMFLGEGKHKIKKKAEQIACESAIQNLRAY
jgi:dsRNA-specific ribonuclease